VEITDRRSEETLLRDSYQVPASDDGILVENVVTTTGRYYVEATVENTGESASRIWDIPGLDNPKNYAIMVGISTDGSLEISGDGIQ